MRTIKKYIKIYLDKQKKLRNKTGFSFWILILIIIAIGSYSISGILFGAYYNYLWMNLFGVAYSIDLFLISINKVAYEYAG